MVLNFDIIFLNMAKKYKYVTIHYVVMNVVIGQSRRGHGAICLFYKFNLKQVCFGAFHNILQRCADRGIIIQEIDSGEFIWVKMCKSSFWVFETDWYVCFVYIPPSNSVYFLSHETFVLLFFFSIFFLLKRFI